MGVFVASADVEGAFDGIKHDDVEKAVLQKGVHPESVCSLLRESSDLKGRINLPGAPMSPAFLYAPGARQGSVEGPDMWNQVLDNALREPAARWETEGIGFMLDKDYRKVQKRRRGSSGDVVKDEGRVLHHLCWADDLYAMASQDVIKAAGNTELCEIIDVEPKAQCRACLAYWDVGIVHCTCGHFLRDDTAENKKYIKSVLDPLSIPNFYIRKGRPHGHRYGKKEGDKEYHTANQLKKKCRNRGYNNIHDRFNRDTWFRKSMLEMDRTEEVIREMDKLANEDHTHIATEEELDVYRGNWWIRSNFVGSDTMPIRHRPDFKEALSTLRRLKNAEDQADYQNWWQSSSSSWWQWQDSWWHPSSSTSPRRWT